MQNIRFWCTTSQQESHVLLSSTKAAAHCYMYVVKRLYRVLSILDSNEEFFCTEVSFEHEWWKEKQKNNEQFYDK